MDRILIHAPTKRALARARRNARNVLAMRPDAKVEIVVNAGGAAAAIAEPDADSDAMTRVCENSLAAQSITPPDSVRT